MTRDASYTFEGAEIFTDLQKAIEFAKNSGEVELMVIGGGEIYRQCMPFADRIYVTRVHAEIDGDVYFPELDPNIWELKTEGFHEKDEKHNYAFTFQTFERTEIV